MNIAQEQPTLPITRLSPSSMAKFVKCPEQYRQKYLLGKQERTFGARFMGSADHETIAEVLRRKMAGDTIGASEIVDIYKKTWNRLLEEEEEGVDWFDDDPAEMYARGLQMSCTYFEEVVPKINPVAIEERVTATIAGIEISGYVDVIERDKIRERKTAKQKQVKPKSDWKLQGLVYQFITGLPIQWDVVTRQVTTKIYTGEEEEGLRLESSNLEATKRIVWNVATRISDLYERYGADHPWPTDGYLSDWACDYCGVGPRYGGTCEMWSR